MARVFLFSFSSFHCTLKAPHDMPVFDAKGLGTSPHVPGGFFSLWMRVWSEHVRFSHKYSTSCRASPFLPVSIPLPTFVTFSPRGELESLTQALRDMSSRGTERRCLNTTPSFGLRPYNFRPDVTSLSLTRSSLRGGRLISAPVSR